MNHFHEQAQICQWIFSKITVLFCVSFFSNDINVINWKPPYLSSSFYNTCFNWLMSESGADMRMWDSSSVTMSAPSSSVCPAELDRWWRRRWITAAGWVTAVVYRRPSLLSWFHSSEHQKEQLSEYNQQESPRASSSPSSSYLIIVSSLEFKFCCHKANDIFYCPSNNVESVCVICPRMNLLACASFN